MLLTLGMQLYDSFNVLGTVHFLWGRGGGGGGWWNLEECNLKIV